MVKDIFLEHLDLQEKLNISSSGDGWMTDVTEKGKGINWKRCIRMECSELIDSYPWKHWKNINTTPDYDNIIIETTDIWHFVLSVLLREHKELVNFTYTKLVNLIYSYYINDNRLKSNEDELQIVSIEKLIESTFKDNSTGILHHFFEMMFTLNIDLDTLHRFYIGKNVLNIFRQDNGYADGTYIKIWNNEEDNVVMKRLIEDMNNVTYDKLYTKLDTVYKDMMNE